jgi:hypothetical protein
MRIIVLEGLSNRGKTSTIWHVRDLLLNNMAIENSIHVYGTNPTYYVDDFLSIFDYNGKKVGVFSMGDNSTILAQEIYNFASQNCDVVVCALSTGTPKVRANKAINNFPNQRIPKTISPNASAELVTNTADAQTIFNLI